MLLCIGEIPCTSHATNWGYLMDETIFISCLNPREFPIHSPLVFFRLAVCLLAFEPFSWIEVYKPFRSLRAFIQFSFSHSISRSLVLYAF